jgi:hypothetical protein
MLTMLSVLYVNDDPLRPVKCVTDKAYGRTNHLRPLHTSVELRMMNPNERALAEEEDVFQFLSRSRFQAGLLTIPSFRNWAAGFFPP